MDTITSYESLRKSCAKTLDRVRSRTSRRLYVGMTTDMKTGLMPRNPSASAEREECGLHIQERNCPAHTRLRKPHLARSRSLGSRRCCPRHLGTFVPTTSSG